ncbi:aminoglycoside phosphotransferase (APT) family kinase protein [Blastococcus colisei]|uniref:Aminoglycoside phosphotransferase (APT) family kinase protein n=1 Tax=Blastococcus colisei TaxID=1564162 RepID=A0A543PHZ8_9ACTN|nr:aminoglycoside phosphotransferase family protein [Blastococcus colisei]TQN43677.1 aminoglycoside phosphotransferase (APT) family kinase protein [Blastococcus colisei]
MGRADVYSQPDAPDPVLPAALVAELGRGHLPDDLVLDGDATVEVDESGGEARVYLLNGAARDGRGPAPARGHGGVVVKTQRPHRLRPRTSLAKEAALLTALAGALAGRIPRVYGYDCVETDVGWVEFIVMSRIPGRAVGRTSLPPPTRRELLRELAGVLRVVHALDAGGLRTAGVLPVAEGAAGLRERLEPNFADLVENLTSRPDRWPLDVSPGHVAERALAALPRHLDQPPVALHSNPGPTHAFTDPAGRFTGLIDFGDAYASHPALDLRSWPDPHDRLALREHYLQGAAPSAEWDAVWTAAMIYADLAALAGSSAHAHRAAADLTDRLGQV